MKVHQQTNEVESSGTLANAGFGISMNSKVARMLSEQVYSDPILAVVREYTCNAIDAHKMVGNTAPIHITIPSALNPVWVVRDFGPGLSQAQIMGTPENKFRGLFNTYGHSGKDDSDLFIGGFGLGSKAGFAYTRNTSAFTVTSWHGGMKHVFTAHMNEANLPSITMLACEASNEPNGVEITIPVAIKDIKMFVERTKDVCKFLENKPKFLGGTIEFDTYTYMSKGKDWKRYALTNYGASYHPTVVVIGGIGYPVASRHFTGDAQSAINSCFEVQVPIGAVELSLSRESLNYDERTIQYLDALFSRIVREVRDQYGEELKAADSTYYEKCVKMLDYNNDPLVRHSRVGHGLPYKFYHIDGRELETQFKYEIDSSKTPDLQIAATNDYEAVHGRVNFIQYGSFAHSIKKTPTYFVWDDTTVARKKPKFRRIRELVKDCPKGQFGANVSLVVIRTAAEATFNSVVKALGDSPHIFILSKLQDMFEPEDDKDKTKRAPGDMKRSINVLYNSRGATNKSYFKYAELDFGTKDTVYYALTKNYKLYKTGDCDSGEIIPSTLCRAVSELKEEGLVTGEVYLIPSTYECHVSGKSNFVNIYDLMSKLTVTPALRKAAEMFDEKFEDELEKFKTEVHNRMLEIAAYNTTKLCAAVRSYKRDTSKLRAAAAKVESIREVHKALGTGVDIPPVNYSTNKVIDFSKYPMLKCIKGAWYMDNAHWKIVATYIKDMEDRDEKLPVSNS